MTREAFAQLAQEIILLDGATGTNLYAAGMPKNVCTEAWILEHPETMIQLQKAYAAAGSQIVYAPTFSANRISLAKHGLESETVRMNRELVSLTRAAVGPDVLVAGDMTTVGELLEPIGELEEEELFSVYCEQAEALAQAGADLIVAETLMCVQEAHIALGAVRAVCALPFMASLTVQADGRAIFGGSAREAAECMQAEGADAVGINCSSGPDQLERIVQEMCMEADIPVLVKPNAGMPITDAYGNVTYPMQPEEFAGHIRRLTELGARIVGGCCGTTPETIRVLHDTIRKKDRK